MGCHNLIREWGIAFNSIALTHHENTENNTLLSNYFWHTAKMLEMKEMTEKRKLNSFTKQKNINQW